MALSQEDKKKLVNKWGKEEPGEYLIMKDSKVVYRTNNFADALIAFNEVAEPGNESQKILNHTNLLEKMLSN